MSPYGRACLQCTKAKVRCAFTKEDRGPCERCARLRKECQPAPRSRVTKPKARVNKHSALEAKLNGLVDILKRNHTIPNERLRPKDPDASSRPQRCGPALAAGPLYQLPLQAGNQARIQDAASSASQHSSMRNHTSGFPIKSAFCALTDEARNNLQESNGPLPASLHSSGTNEPSGVQVQSAFGALTAEARNNLQSPNGPSPTAGTSAGSSDAGYNSTPASSIAAIPPETGEELQDVLDTYRDTMFQFSPILILGPEVTVEYMATERPYVWLVLRMICSKKLLRQLALGKEINRLIATKLIIEGERSFDMLCALVIHVNWGQFSCAKANLSPPIHLAMALAGDLGLTKPAPQTSPGVMMNLTQAGCPKPPHALAIKKRTMEERRVVLGLFYVSSICANFFQRNEPMRWTPYLEECLALMTEVKEQPTDELLVLLIRVQIIANGLQAEGWNETYPHASSGLKSPRAHHAHVHKMQLDDLKRTIPAHLKDSPVLRYHIIGAEVCLYEQYLHPPSSVNSTIDQTKHIEGLWACFATVKSYFDRFFDTGTIPLAAYLYFSISVYTHLGHCLVALFRLSTFEAPDIPWDRQHIIEQIDLGTIVRQWIHVFESSPKAAGIDVSGGCEQDSQWEYSKRILLTTILKWWETKVRPSILGCAEGQQQAPGAGQESEQPQDTSADAFDAAMPALGDLGEMDFHFDTEFWMRDMFNSGFDFRTF